MNICIKLAIIFTVVISNNHNLNSYKRIFFPIKSTRIELIALSAIRGKKKKGITEPELENKIK